MNPMLLAVGAAGLGFIGYKAFKKPGKEDYQTMNVTGATGVPVTIATPVSYVVTPAQATATPVKPPVAGTPPPVPTTVPGVGVTYAPPGTITLVPSVTGQQVLQPAPIVVTPSGAASIAIGSIKDVQHALNTLGFAKPPLVKDGKLGPKTIAAVRAFQSKYKLVVDGNAGPATRAALSAALTALAGGTSAIGATAQNSQPQSGVATTPTGVVIDTTAALAMTTKAIQNALNRLGTSPKLVEDGNIGPKTVAAIKSFQTAHGLTPDGIAGPKTKTSLQLALAQSGR